MKKFVIAGAGGFGREVYSYLLNTVGSENIRGFLDDNLDALASYSFYHKIISTFSDYTPLENDAVIFAIASPKSKKIVAKILQDRGANFENFIHPSAVINLNVKIASGVVIAPFCVINSNAEIGEFVAINVATKISNGATLGAFSTISSQCVVGEKATLKSGAFMASSSILKSGATLLEDAFLGINSYVEKDVSPSKCAFGNPAKEL